MSFYNNSMKGDKKIIKDLPPMRSVVLRSASSLEFPSPLARMSQSAYDVKPSHGKSRPLPQIQSWKVLDNSLKELPDFYPLERTNATVHNATAQQVIDRIAECLRQQSVAATFDAEKAAVQAETREQVRFIVRLFNSDGKVIVEVQRRCGCAFVFHQCSDAVLAAAQGVKRPRAMPKFSIPDCVKEAAAMAARQEEAELRAVESDLDIALQLLKSDRYDAQLLGLESLIMLTQQSKFAAFCAHSLLCSKCVQEMMLELLLHSEDIIDDGDNFVVEHMNLMRRHSLTILANCMEALTSSGELRHVVDTNESWQSTNLLNTLIAALSTAEEEPHNAHQAARCLGSLCRCSSLCREHAMDVGAPDAISKALNVGMQRHALLEGASRRLQIEMGFSS